MDPVERIAVLGGAARFGEIGATRRELAQLVEQGRLRQLCRGGYAVPDAPASLVAAVRENAVVSCRSALELLGVEAYGDGTISHLSLPPSRGSGLKRPRGVRRHRELPERHGATRVASLVDAAARAAVCLPYDLAVAQVERVVHDREGPLLAAILDRVARGRPGRARALAVDVEPGARSHVETAVRLHLRRAGLGVLAAVFVPGVGEVDLLVEGLIIVELDGFAYHGDRRQYRNDRRRDRAALRLGLPTLRFAFEDSDPDKVLREVLIACRQVQRQRLAADPAADAASRAAVDRARAAATAPAARAVGWTHLRGRDRAVVKAALPTLRWQR